MHDLVAYLAAEIPLAGHMEIQAGSLTEEWFELLAPLRPNLNYKNTAFGGSLATLCTLAGWCAITKVSRQRGIDADFSVVDSQIRYQQPVTSDPIRARAYFPTADVSEEFFDKLRTRSKAFIEIRTQVITASGEGEEVAVDFTASFHATLL